MDGAHPRGARGPLDAETLRVRLGLHQRSARDFFDALAALKLLERRAGKYSNSPEADLFLDRAKPSYVGGYWRCAASGCSGIGPI